MAEPTSYFTALSWASKIFRSLFPKPLASLDDGSHLASQHPHGMRIDFVIAAALLRIV